MASPLTLNRAWRLFKEVDLEAVRREAARHLGILIVGESTREADELAVCLAQDQPDPGAWLTAIDAAIAVLDVDRASNRGRAEPVVDGPDVVVFVSSGTAFPAALEPVRRWWTTRGVRNVVVAVGGDERHGKVRTQGTSARVAIDRLDAAGFDAVTDAIFSVVEAEKRLALARQFPALRSRVFNALIDETARANAGYAFSTGLAEIVPLLDIPLNIGDVIVLTKNQLMMSYRLALAAGKDGRPKALIGEILGVLGGGLLFRQIARQLIGLVPAVGIIPKVAVAYGGTWAIGRAVVLWATEGEKLTGDRLKQLSREGLARGREVARAIRHKD
jgi:uncharacterized protein (DUF697 family)